jgi:hypothetical protein
MAGPSVSKRLPVPVFLTTSAGVDASDTTNNANKVTLATTLAGEDVVNDVQKVEQRYAYSVPIVASAAIKSGPGFLHALIISQNDAAPTAGTIDVYDSTAASGNKIFSWTLTTAVFMPFSLILDVSFTVGLYVAITTTADVNVSASYR